MARRKYHRGHRVPERYFYKSIFNIKYFNLMLIKVVFWNVRRGTESRGIAFC